MSKYYDPGTCVWLKTGGPAMMVTGLPIEIGMTNTEWFDDNKILHRDTFDTINLTDKNPYIPVINYDISYADYGETNISSGIHYNKE